MFKFYSFPDDNKAIAKGIGAIEVIVKAMNTHMDNAEVYKSGWSVLGIMGVGTGQESGADGGKSMASIVVNTLDKNIDDEETCKNCFRIIDAFSIKDGNTHKIIIQLHFNPTHYHYIFCFKI